MSYEAFACVYDRLTANVDRRSMAEFIRDRILAAKPDAELVLDMACGTGTLAIELERLGFDMTAVDSSVDMLNIAREKSDGSILFLRQRMEKLDMFGTMGAIVCTLDSINHVTDPAKVREIFRRAALFLDDDGVFIFDANTPYKHRKVLANNVFVYDLDDIYCVWQNSTDSDLVTDIELDFFVRDDASGSYVRSGERFRERAYGGAQLDEMLSAAGFEITERYDDYTDEPPRDTTQRIVYICRKRR